MTNFDRDDADELTAVTSNANVARALHIGYLACRAMDGNVGGNWQADADRLRALADALDAQAATPWEERVKMAADAYEDAKGDNNFLYRELDAALRAAFPELAPGDD